MIRNTSIRLGTSLEDGLVRFAILTRKMGTMENVAERDKCDDRRGELPIQGDETKSTSDYGVRNV